MNLEEDGYIVVTVEYSQKKGGDKMLRKINNMPNNTSKKKSVARSSAKNWKTPIGKNEGGGEYRRKADSSKG